jgi:hypothetical protein
LTGAVEVRTLRASDEGPLIEAWNSVFAGAGKARSLDWVRWSTRVLLAPGKLATTLRRIVVARTSAEVVAAAVGIPAPTWIDGREHVFTHVGDVFVRPAARRGLAREGLALRTVRALLEVCEQEGGDALVYGWPIRAHARLGRRLLGYEKVMGQVVLGRALGAREVAAPEVLRVEDYGRAATWLWERCASRWPGSTCRDAAWLRWRYLQRPDVHYDGLVLPGEDETWRGLCVLAPGGFLGEDVGLIADWLVPEDDLEAADVLTSAAAAHAARRGARALGVILPAWSPWFSYFQELGWRVHPSELELHFRPFHARFDAAFLRDGWWYQLGDGDLV